MMILTAKVDIKKILLVLSGIAVVILFLILLLGGKDGNTTQTAAMSTPTNDGRVKFLKDFGWDVTNSPKESSQVIIPKESNEVFDRYNALQKTQGYDLSQYAGKNVMRYVYQINNYPNAKEPVYATILVYKNRIIGGDITDSSAKGMIHGFQKPTNIPETTVPSTPVAEATQPNTAPEPSTAPTSALMPAIT